MTEGNEAGVLDTLGDMMRAEVERAWREGWSAGYRAGVTDGSSDSEWCDEEGDWLKSETYARSTQRPPLSDEGD